MSINSTKIVCVSQAAKGRDAKIFEYLYLGCFLSHHIIINKLKTRMTTFIKAKLKNSDDQKNINKYRVAANITENHIISK